MRSINKEVRSLAAGVGLDDCLLQHLEGQACRLESYLANNTKDILFLGEDDLGLLDDELRIEEALSSISLSIKRLFQDRTSLRPKAVAGVRLPKISVPSFDGQY